MHIQAFVSFLWTWLAALTVCGVMFRAQGAMPRLRLIIETDTGGGTDREQLPLNSYRGAVIQVRDPELAWKTIASLFEPPAEFVGKYGNYRSPLRGDDGRDIQTAADWPKRRAEILRDWQALMGSWPKLISRPKIEILSRTHRESFQQQRVRLEIGPGQSGEGWLLVPDGAARSPAVLIVYYEPETSVGQGKEPLRDFGYQLARRGFVTLSIGTPGGNAWKPEIGQARCQPLSYHAYVAANCWQALANLPEVDPERIGVMGHSYGGKWALFAAALWDRFAAVAVSDPGVVFDETRPNVNYWEPWYLGAEDAQLRKPGVPGPQNPRTGAYKLLVQQGRDLPELEALIAPRPFLLSGGSEDPPERWLALNHLLRLDQLLGYTNRVAVSNRPHHTPTEKSNEQLFAFFEYFLGRKSN